MSKVIATIKLAPGKVAFYDEYTRIHLTIANPIAQIYEGMNLKRIKASIRSGTLRVISGSLAEPSAVEVKAPIAPVKKVAPIPEAIVETSVITSEPAKVEKVATEEVKAEDIVTEAEVESTVEAPAEKPVKKSKKNAKVVAEPMSEEIKENIEAEISAE